MNQKFKKTASILAISFLLFTQCACSFQGVGKHDDKEVHIAIQPSAAFVPLYIAKEKGWIEEALKEYNIKVVWQEFESGPPMTDSLLAGDSDIGVIGDVPTVTVCAPGNDVSVIAIAAQAADSYAILVPYESKIRKAEDLKGKKVATTYGSTAHNMIEKYLNTAGLTINDIELVNTTVGDTQAILEKGLADAISIWEPNVTRLAGTGDIRILASGSECGLAGTNAIVVRDKYGKDHPEIVTAILAQYKRAVDGLPKMDAATLTALSDELKVTPGQMKRIIAKFKYTITITDEDIAALNDTIRFLNDNKIFRKDYDISESVDRSFYKED
ncbi:MAG: aliphatic sulfonate ABC transporter substrate-binding protein [Lachnospiraceae bacterium]|nr:aliphatic sulfonate ABC transporter substrate-binding protein [Lachnospiraceae bacterium]